MINAATFQISCSVVDGNGKCSQIARQWIIPNRTATRAPMNIGVMFMLVSVSSRWEEGSGE